MHAVITGIGHFVPERKLTNSDLEHMVDTSDEWITTRTGIKERRILEKDKGVSDMAVKATEMILEQRNLSADDIDLIIAATTTSDMIFPSTACLIQQKLNARNCWGFDLVTGCSGFLFALATASQFIESGRYNRVLLIGGDKMSSIINYEDRSTCIIFGDGAGAVLLEPAKENGLGVKDYILHIDGSGGEYLYMPAGGSLNPPSIETVKKKMHYVVQDGRTIFKHAVIGMTDTSAKLMRKNNLSNKDISFLVPHQANARIINSVADKLGLTKDQVIINIHKYGNTTAGSIPIAMSEAYQDGKLKKGDRMILSAFGTGFAWGSLLLTWGI